MFNSTPYTTLIEVITPVYNSGEYLYETYDSLQKQTISDFLWILVNDGSDDEKTNTILERLARNDSRICVIRHKTNRGLPASRNTGIQHARAPYIFFLDADDLIHPSFLEKAYLFLETHRDFQFVNSWVTGFGAQQYTWTGGFHDRELFLKENRNTSCFLSRRTVFDNIRFDEAMRDGCEDWDFWLLAACNNFWGYTIPEYLFFYRRTEKTKWENLKSPGRLSKIQENFYEKYAPILSKKGFPEPQQEKYEFGKPRDQHISLPAKKPHAAGTGSILCLFPWLEMGGADLFNLRLLNDLDKRGWEIILLTTLESKQLLGPAFESITDQVFHLANLGNNYLYISWIRYFIESRKPDVIFLSNSMYGYYLLPWLKINYPHIPVADYVHCEDPGWYNGGYPFFSAIYTNCLDKTFVSSNQLRDWCIKNGADNNKVETCYINVDTHTVQRDPAKRKEIRRQLGLNDSSQLILYVARLTLQKQPEIVADVMARLGKNNFDYKCIIIGDGPEKSSLLSKIHRYKLDERIVFLGAQPNDVVMSYMDAADIFFLPSLYEGIALSIYEAMAKSLVIVGADTGGQSELVTGTCGVLVKEDGKQKEIEKYTMVLSDLLSKPEKIKVMGAAARVRVEEKFDHNRMISQLHEAFLTIKSNKPSNVPNQVAHEYMIVLDRLHHVEKINEELYIKANSRVNQIVQRNKRTYEKARKAYHKVKNLLNNFTAK